MKIIFSFPLIFSASALFMTACSGIVDCTSEDLDGCGRGLAYTEERTVGVHPKPAPVMDKTPKAVPIVSPPPAPMEAPVREKTVEPITKQADPVFDSRLHK